MMNRHSQLLTMYSSGGIPQDQAYIPNYDAQTLYDHVTGQSLSISSPKGVTNDTPPSISFDGSSTNTPVLSLTSGDEPIKHHAGAFTILTRCWGRSSSASGLVMLGDMGSTRGTCLGPNYTGKVSFAVPSASNAFKSISTSDGAMNTTSGFQNWAFTYEPGARMSIWRDGSRLVTDTSSIPATRYINTSRSMKLGNRGDMSITYGYFVGEVQFLFFYEQVLDSEQMDSIFADPVYVPS